MDWTVTGVVKPLSDGSYEVDLRGTIEGFEANVTKRVASRTSSVASKTDEDVQAEIDSCVAELTEELRGHAAEMADLLASENTTGRVALSRVLREVYRPLATATKKLPDAALTWGMEQAVAKGIPNVNYAKRAAEGYSKTPPPPRTPSPTGRYRALGGN